MKNQPNHSAKKISKVSRWWKAGKNVWEISQLTGLSEQVVTEITRSL
jgi:hypothetical protein